ncbi:hypothetical protein HZS_2287 [Henneguya salminicola]|nr:hypothetical protein HZS_2287 [Henneguya salminicola]
MWLLSSFYKISKYYFEVCINLGVRTRTHTMPKISIELEIEENQISDHLNETEIIDEAATPRSLGATPKTIKKHHGTRKYEKIKIESYKSK